MHAESTDLSPFLTHRSFVRNLASSLLRNPADVDEVEQETWISAMQGPGGGVRDARSWLGTVVRHHAFNLTRRGRRLQEREHAAARTEATAGGNQVLERIEAGQVLVALVMRVAEPNRKALLLRYYEDQSPVQIAQGLGVSLSVVKGRLQRGLTELRGLLAAHDSRSGEAWRRDLAALAAAPLPATGLVAGAPSAAVWLGIVGVGALLIAEAFQLPSSWLPWRAASTEPATQARALRPTVQGAALPELLPAQAEPAEAQRSAGSVALAGEIELGIGDAFIFEEQEARPDGDRSRFDLYVQDIRHGVSLATLAGGTVPSQPMTAAGLPEVPRAVMALLKDAPLELPKRDLWLLESSSAERPGIGIAMARSGQAYKLCLIELDGHPEALRRRVRIAYEPIPSVEGGGVLQLPEAEGQPASSTLEAIREGVRIGKLIPGDSFSNYLNGSYTAYSELADGTVPEEGAFVALEQELTQAVRLSNRSALFAGEGIQTTGSVVLDAYGAIGVQGPMRGHMELNSYGYAYLDGPLEGSLHVNSYGTVVLEQGLTGTLKIRSYADVLIRGPVHGDFDIEGSCWSTLYLDGVHAEQELRDLCNEEGDFHQFTLHVRISDLPDGEHEDIGSWRKVIVGDPIWNKLGR